MAKHPRGNVFDKLADLRAQHRERRESTGFAFAFADRIDSLNPAHWDQVTRGASWFLGRDYLSLVEEHGPSRFQHRYALISAGADPVAAVSVQCVDLPAASLVSRADGKGSGSKRKRDRFKNLLRRARNKGLSQVVPRILVCGSLLTWGQHGVAIRAGGDPALIWRGIAEALYRIRRADKLHGTVDLVLLKDVPAGSCDGIEALRRIRYRPFETEPDMVLALDPRWKSFEDYLGGLSARYRKAAQKLRRALDDSGFVLAPLEDLAPHESELHELYLQVHDKARLRPVTLPAAYLPALARLAGRERMRCTVARQRGAERLAGFVTTVKDGGGGLGYLIGIDYAANRAAPIYLSLLQQVVADGIALGCQSLSLGRTALEPKSRLGAQPVPTEVWLRHRLPIVNHILHPLLRTIPHDEAPERSPFKETRGGGEGGND
ncbi:MAG: GNAT family N-acetyltransferase [Planctomycetes bacterium]|nr:GNAT family N-acetyltransferase [Planctomycetota bacterium]